MRPGDKVKMTPKYMEYEKHRDEIFVVDSEPWMCCGTEIVRLKGYGTFATDGLQLVAEAPQPKRLMYYSCPDGSIKDSTGRVVINKDCISTEDDMNNLIADFEKWKHSHET